MFFSSELNNSMGHWIRQRKFILSYNIIPMTEQKTRQRKKTQEEEEEDVSSFLHHHTSMYT